MTATVIVGAGPIGLYLAYTLRRAGIAPIMIIDPRAGMYERPGHVNVDVFKRLNRDFREIKWSKLHGHIYDFENILYEYLRQSEGVVFKRKKFIGFRQDDKYPGVIVANETGLEKFIKCKLVFDCTGVKRLLIHNINNLVTPPPFDIKPIVPNITIKKHLLFYGTMNKSDFDKLNSLPDFSPKDPVHTLKYFVKLRALGWKEFSYPYCYGARFENDNTVLYLECPEDLTKDNYLKWMHAVFRTITYSSKKINFQQSDQISNNLSLHVFTSIPQKLDTYTYQRPGLPRVIAMGDAHIEPYHRLAHGIKNGMERVSMFIKSVHVVSGKIVNIDFNKYESAIRTNVTKHSNEIKLFYKMESERFVRGLKEIQTYYKECLKIKPDFSLDPRLQTEIDTRVRIQNINKLYKATLRWHKNNLIFLTQRYSIRYKNLIEIKNECEKPLENGATLLEQNTFHVMDKLKDTGLGLIALANRYLVQKKYGKALIIYLNGTDIFHKFFPASYHEILVQAHAKIIFCHAKLDQKESLLKFGEFIFALYNDKPDLLNYKKIALTHLIETIKIMVFEENENWLKTSFIQLLTPHLFLLDEPVIKEPLAFLHEKPEISTPSRGQNLNHGFFKPLSSDPIVHNENYSNSGHP
ncbi:MAG TPA: hypothetical protein PK657_05040 [Legionella sp.]|nr:hypothetical protein [Legionella sp.]